MHLALLAIMAGLLPILAVHGSYWISIQEGFSPACFPYLEGCTTISGAARNGNALFLFRGVLIPCCIIMVIYWRATQLWFQQLTGDTQKHRAVFLVGATGALFLIIYADYLGTKGEGYQWMRRYGIFMFFGLTPLAQLLQIRTLTKIAQSDPTIDRFKTLITLKGVFCFVMLSCGVASVSADWLGLKTYELGSALEWVFAWFIFTYFFITAYIWHKLELCFSLNSLQ